MSESDDGSGGLASLFGLLGGVTGCSVAAQSVKGEEGDWIVLLIGFGIGLGLGRFVGHVVWRLILVGLFLLFVWLRMQACGVIREQLRQSDWHPSERPAIRSVLPSQISPPWPRASSSRPQAVDLFFGAPVSDEHRERIFAAIPRRSAS